MTARRDRTVPRGDDGSILLLAIGFCAIAMLLVWAVIDVSVVFLARRDLAATVDGAALAAVQEVDAAAVYTGDGAADLPLDRDAVIAAVARYVAGPGGSPADQRVVGVVDDGGRAVVVRGEREVRLPVFGTVTVTARATATNHRQSGAE